MSAARGTETPGVDLGAMSSAQREDVEDALREADRIQGFSDMLEMDADDFVLALLDTPATDRTNLAALIERIIAQQIMEDRAHCRGELIPASAVEALADGCRDRAAYCRSIAVRASSNGHTLNRREANVWDVAERDLRALVKSARAGDAP